MNISLKLSGKFLFDFFLILSFILIPFAVKSQSVDELLAEGDKAVEEFNSKKALDIYLKADKISPGNWQILWRISRSYVDIAEHMPAETGDQEDAQYAEFEKALSYAENTVKLAPDQSISYIRRAAANGKIALFKGVFSVAGIVNKVKEDCEKAIKLNNGGNYVQALAHYILGRTHAKVSEKWAPARALIGLGWADKETALKELKKAVELFPDFRMFLLDLGKIYLDEDEETKAKETLTKVLSTPKKDEDDDELLKEAKQLLDEIKKG
ncbi:MAG: tetratricopeptide repeat protein [Ignavibacteria bacterium]